MISGEYGLVSSNPFVECDCVTQYAFITCRGTVGFGLPPWTDDCFKKKPALGGLFLSFGRSSHEVLGETSNASTLKRTTDHAKLIATMATTASANPVNRIGPGRSPNATIPTSAPNTTTPMLTVENTNDGCAASAW